jgi:hypothetical protein
MKEILIEPVGPTEEGARGLLSPKSAALPIKLNTELLKNNLASFIDAMNEMLSGLPKLTEPFKLNEIELVVEVNGEGSIQLVGGIKVGASGGITLKLTR